MEQVYNQANHSMFILKLVGLIFSFIGLMFVFKARSFSLPHWKNVIGIGCMFGILNAGLVLSIGRMAFYATPIMLVLFFALFWFNKFPRLKMKHLIGLLSTFIFSSVIFYLGIAGIFFHLAVEGRI